MIYGMNNIFNESVVDIDIDNIEESKYEPNIQGAMIHVLETEENWNTMMEAVALDELTYFKENGATEMVYEAGKISGFIGKIKEFFKKIIEKITSLFKKFIAIIDSYTKSDSDFVKKYRNSLINANTKDFTFKGFNFTIGKLDINKCEKKTSNYISSKIPVFSNSIPLSTLQDTVTKVRENREDILENMRGLCVGQTSVEAGEFATELFKYLRDGEESPIEIDKINVSDFLTVISNTNKCKKDAEKAYKDLKKTIEDIIKSLDKSEKEYTKDIPNKDEAETKLKSAQVQYISTESSLLKDQVNILQIVNGAILSAIKAENRQAKSVCVKLLTYKPKNESYGFNESASYIDSVSFK